MSFRRLLAVFAHPDDESFGPGATLAKYAREGVQVHVCTVTDGAAGVPEADPLIVARLRRQELECACQVLGVRLHMLSYGDSGMEGSPWNKHPTSLYQANLDQVARDVVRVMRSVRPHVVLAPDPTGGYFHPDHIRVNHAVRRALARVGDPSAYPTLAAEGYEPWQPARLYYTVIPRATLKWLTLILRLQCKDPRRFGRNGDIDLTRIGVPDEAIHVRLLVEAYLDIKQAASACHHSQGGGDSGPWQWLPGFLRRRLQRYEYFVQAYPLDAVPHDDLFAGLELADE